MLVVTFYFESPVDVDQATRNSQSFACPFPYQPGKLHCCSLRSSCTFSYVLYVTSSVYETNFSAGAIKCILISNCSESRLYKATPPSE